MYYSSVGRPLLPNNHGKCRGEEGSSRSVLSKRTSARSLLMWRKHSSQTFPIYSLAPPARQAASLSYFPIVAALNSGYLFLRLVYQWSSVTVSRCVAAAFLVALSFFAYKGILEDHANTIPKGKGSSNALAGGASLDLLGLVVVIQFGTAFVSEKIYWLLIFVPLWAGWNIYATFFRSKAGGNEFTPTSQTMNTGAIEEEIGDYSKATRNKTGKKSSGRDGIERRRH